ncbi:MAG: diacylglycerol kinase family lipid kinase [Parasporobacterium sp.]|nr:diacylglycerol kinase family lipid kinase [Parasporobacterium sp.]
MYHFITNPNSGHGAEAWHTIENYLNAHEIEYRVHFTRHDSHATEIVRTLTEACEEINIIALGGDGSVNEVINGITDLEKVNLGYIPTGSGNDLARALKLPKNVITCLEMVLSGKYRRSMDVGVMKTGSSTRRFIVSSGFGFDAAVCYGILHSNLKKVLNKIRLGGLVYLFVALKEIFSSNGNKVTLYTDDGEPETFDNCLFAAAMNHSYEGGGFCFCPVCIDDDGYLDMCLVSDISKIKFLALLPTAFSGKHVRFKKYVHIYRAKHFRLESDKKLHTHTDGEIGEMSMVFEAYLENKKLIFCN